MRSFQGRVCYVDRRPPSIEHGRTAGLNDPPAAKSEFRSRLMRRFVALDVEMLDRERSIMRGHLFDIGVRLFPSVQAFRLQSINRLVWAQQPREIVILEHVAAGAAAGLGAAGCSSAVSFLPHPANRTTPSETDRLMIASDFWVFIFPASPLKSDQSI